MAKDWQAVADAINARLAEQGMTQKDLATSSGVSTATLRKLQKGEPGQRGTPLLAAVSSALGWPPHYLQAVSDGGQLDLDDPVAALRDEVATVRAELHDVRERLAKVEAVQEGGPR